MPRTSKTTKPAPSTAGAVGRQAAKFGLVGISNTVIDFVVLQTLTRFFNVPLNLTYLAKFFSGSLAMINSFYWNRRWVFKSQASVGKSGVRFLVATLVSVYAIQPGAVYAFTGTTPGVAFSAFWYHLAQYLHITNLLPNLLTEDFVIKTVAFGCGVIGSAIWNFTLYRFWAFREDK
jgi:putative flippase GtrA